jgi:hypothetical protein
MMMRFAVLVFPPAGQQLFVARPAFLLLASKQVQAQQVQRGFQTLTLLLLSPQLFGPVS